MHLRLFHRSSHLDDLVIVEWNAAFVYEPTGSEDRIFRCRHCGYVYTDDPDVARSRCSQCGQMNEAIKF